MHRTPPEHLNRFARAGRTVVFFGLSIVFAALSWPSGHGGRLLTCAAEGLASIGFAAVGWASLVTFRTSRH